MMANEIKNPEDEKVELRESFAVLSRRADGSISASELRHVMTSLGDKLTDEEVDEIIREVSANRAGEIHYEGSRRHLRVILSAFTCQI